jgi:phage tail sheath protein FI
MPEYLHPGVYIEEQPAPQTITGVSTSTAGLVGVTEKGPSVGLPQLVTSFTDFVRRYGAHLDEDWGQARYLAHAVEGFFVNGGQRAYIARVVGPGGQAASATFNDGFATRLTDDLGGDAATRDEVRLVSLRGISVGTRLIFSETIAGNDVTETRTVVGYDAGGTVTLDAALGNRFTEAGCTVTIDGVPAPAEGAPSITVEANSEGQWGNALTVAIEDMYGSVGLTDAAAIATSTELTGVALAFSANGPDPRAVEATLDDASELAPGDRLRFADAGDSEERELVAVDTTSGVVGWDVPLANDYSGANATVERISGLLRPARPMPLRPETTGPASGDEEVALADVEGIETGDTLVFRNPDGDVERVVVDSVDATTGDVEWTGGLTNDYDDEDATIHLVPRRVVPVEDTTGFGTDDLVRITQGGRTQIVAISGVDATDNELTLDVETHPVLAAYDAGALLELGLAGTDGNDRVDLRSARNFAERDVIEIDDGSIRTYHVVDEVDGRSLVLEDPLQADVPFGATVRVVSFRLAVDHGTTSETFAGLSLDPAAARYAPAIVNPASRLVRVTDRQSARDIPFNLPQLEGAPPSSLDGGDPGAAPPADDFQGVDNGPGQRSAIQALADIDAVSIIAAPGISDAVVHGHLIAQCSELKDRFAVLDPAPWSDVGSGAPSDVIVQRNAHDTLYAAMYYPWLRAPDPLEPEETISIPPSGHVAGVYARVDEARGVHKAPANEVVLGISDVERKIGDREQDILNPLNLNVIRDFRESQRGLRVWGARCLTSDDAWMYVPVRRLFIFLEESLSEGLQWVVFEPNAEPLWARVRRTITGFLRRVWLDGALAGVTEEEAFFVRCDRTTMTEDQIAAGQLVVLVGVAPVRPAEFVIIRIGQKTLEATG